MPIHLSSLGVNYLVPPALLIGLFWGLQVAAVAGWFVARRKRWLTGYRRGLGVTCLLVLAISLAYWLPGWVTVLVDLLSADMARAARVETIALATHRSTAGLLLLVTFTLIPGLLYWRSRRLARLDPQSSSFSNRVSQ